MSLVYKRQIILWLVRGKTKTDIWYFSHSRAPHYKKYLLVSSLTRLNLGLYSPYSNHTPVYHRHYHILSIILIILMWIHDSNASEEKLTFYLWKTYNYCIIWYFDILLSGNNKKHLLLFVLFISFFFQKYIYHTIYLK